MEAGNDKEGCDERRVSHIRNCKWASVHSTMGLCRYLIEKYNFLYVLSGKINQDNLEVISHDCNHMLCKLILALSSFLIVSYAIIFRNRNFSALFVKRQATTTILPVQRFYNYTNYYQSIAPIYGNCTVTNRKLPEILVSVDDLMKIYDQIESKISEIARKLQLKLDELVEYEDWEIDELQEHDYCLHRALNCIIYYVTSLAALYSYSSDI